MKFVALSLLLILAACGPDAPPQTASTQNEIRTIESSDPHAGVIDPPPELSDESPAPKPKNPVDAERLVPLTPQDEQIRAQLPFAPAIAMDPVDGSKVSIRATTPSLKYRNRIYYFSSEQNKRSFVANPDQFTKGAFSHL